MVRKINTYDFAATTSLLVDKSLGIFKSSDPSNTDQAPHSIAMKTDEQAGFLLVYLLIPSAPS